MYANNVIKLIESYIGISVSEKKLLGEVFTPLDLINEMLDTLPQEVWSNPNLKWLDPANGVGNFPLMIIERLMNGLKGFETDDAKRYKHIMEKMIYVCDINPKNMFMFNNLFNPNNEITLNTYGKSFILPEFNKWMKEKGVDKFDIIIGNPPYQETSESEQKQSNQSKVKLWMKFVEKSLLLCDNLLFITPNNWLYTTCHLYNIYMPKLVSCEIDSKYLQSKYFKGIGSTFSYYLLNNNTTNNKIQYDGVSIIKVSNNKVTSSLNIFPTTIINDKTISIFSKIFNNKSDTFNFTREKYSKINNTKNVIFINRSRNDDFCDFNDTIGSTSSYWIEFDNEPYKNNAKTILNSKLYKMLIKNLRSGMAIVSSVNFLPKLDLFKLWNDNELYNYFNLTKEEIDYIEKTIK